MGAIMALFLWFIGIYILYLIISSAINNSDLNSTLKEINKNLKEINDKLGSHEPPLDSTTDNETIDYDEFCPGCGANITKEDSECPECGLRLVD